MLLGGGLDADLRDIHLQRGGDVLPHGLPVRGHLGRLGDQGGVNVHHGIALLPEVFPHPLQQHHAGDIAKGLVIIREQLADVPGGDGAQQGVHDGVGQHVRV